MNNQTKICTKCKVEKDVSEFCRSKSIKDGRESNCKACKRVSNARWRSKNKERKAATDAKWRSENTDYHAKWAKSNPQKCRAYSSNRRATLLKNITPTTCLKTIELIYAQCPEGYEVDHIRPSSKKGPHHQDNLCFLPESLNRAKNNKLLSEHPELRKRFDAEVIYPKY